MLIGYFARKVHSLPLGILFGLAVGAFLAFLVAQMQGKYYLEIMLPGSLVGVIVGYSARTHSRWKYSSSRIEVDAEDVAPFHQSPSASIGDQLPARDGDLASMP